MADKSLPRPAHRGLEFGILRGTTPRRFLVVFPHGRLPKGSSCIRLMVSCQHNYPNPTASRSPLAAGSRRPTLNSKDEATSYIAYTGPFHVDEEKQHRTHSMFISLFPNWIGQTQPRVDLESMAISFLLNPASPISSGGKIVNSHLACRRAAIDWSSDHG